MCGLYDRTHQLLLSFRMHEKFFNLTEPEPALRIFAGRNLKSRKSKSRMVKDHKVNQL